MIEFKNTTKIYNNDIFALSNINLEIDRGEFVFIVGSSGAGKSTFIKLLHKEVNPTTGRIIVNGEDITKLKMSEIPYYRRKLGMVFQDFRLIPNLSVYENVSFAMRAVGTPYREIKKRVPLVISMVGLSHKFDCFPDELSGGEQQRAALARAIVNNPSVLIADEPTGNLDPETSKEIMKILNDINRAGTTIIMATHDKRIVDNMKKRVIAIEKGVIVRDEQRGRYGYEN